MTGNEWLAHCADKDHLFFVGICVGLGEAIAAVVEHRNGAYGSHACVPENSTQQLVDVVKRYLDQHPEQRHYSATSFAAAALAAAFPCKQ
jgi:hypothetical protein